MKNSYKGLLFVSLVYSNLFFASAASVSDFVAYTDGEENKLADEIGTNVFKLAFLAIHEDNIENVRTGIDQRKDILFMVYKKCTLLSAAILNSRTKICELLIEKGADINSQSKEIPPPLHLAVAKGAIDIVKLLINKSTALSKNPELGKGALLAAASFESKDIAKQMYVLLLDSGVNVNYLGTSGGTALNDAVILGAIPIVELLIRRGASVHLKGGTVGEPLYHAIEAKVNASSRMPIVQLLVEAGANVNSEFSSGSTPLNVAIGLDLRDVVEFLIKKGADIDLKNHRGETPLHIAVQSDNWYIAGSLIQKGANINMESNEGITPFHYAIVESNSTTLCELLLENGADLKLLTVGPSAIQKGSDLKVLTAGPSTLPQTVNERLLQTINDRCSGFLSSCSNRDICELLITNRPHIFNHTNVGDRLNQEMLSISSVRGVSYFDGKIIGSVTLLILTVFLWKFWFLHLFSKPVSNDIFKAIQDRDIRSCEKILKSIRGAILLTNNSGHTALHEACIHGHKEICELLIKKGAQVNDQTKEGLSPLMLAAAVGMNEVAKLLLQQKNLNKKLKNLAGETALFVACVNNNVELCKLMLLNEFDPNERTKKNVSLLHDACLKDSEELVELFFKHQENVNVQDDQGSTALHYACRKGSDKLVKKLLTDDLRNRIRVNLPDDLGNSALFYAIENNSVEKVRLLVRYGAQIEKEHLMSAVKARYVDVFKILRAAVSTSAFNQIKNQLSVVAGGHDEFKIFFDNYQLLPLDSNENQDVPRNSFADSSERHLQSDLSTDRLEDSAQNYFESDILAPSKNTGEQIDQVSEGENEEVFE